MSVNNPLFLILMLLLTPLFTEKGVAQPVFQNAYESFFNGDVVIDQNGNTIKAGMLLTDVDLDKDGTPDLVTNGESDIIIVSLSPMGEINWLRQIGNDHPNLDGSYVTEFALGIAQDVQGHVYVFGSFHGTLDFDNDGVEDVSSVNPERTDTFLAKYTTEGDLLWITSFPHRISSFGDIQFVSDTGTVYLMSNVPRDQSTATSPFLFATILLIAVDKNGTLIWERLIETNHTSVSLVSTRANSLRLDTANNLYILGAFEGTIDFDGDGPMEPLINTGRGSFYMVKFAQDGTIQWARSGDGYRNFARYLHIDEEDGIWVHGFYGGPFQLHSSDSTYVAPEIQNNPFGSKSSAFIARYDTSGNISCVKFVKNSDEMNPAGAMYQGGPIIQPSKGSIILLGLATGEMDFNNDGIPELPVSDSLAMDRPSSIFTSLNLDCSHNWTWVSDSGINLYNLSHAYDQYHLDGILFKEVLTLDGLEDEHPLVNTDTSQFSSYSFSVRIENFDGILPTELSEERSISNVQNQDYSLTDAYPNPFNPQASFTISIARTQNVRIELFDLNGRLVRRIHSGPLLGSTTHSFTIDGSSLSSGTYLYRIQGENFASSRSIVLIR